MTGIVKAPKDFWTGVIYLAIGGAALWIGADYRMGSASRMGAGYFPKVLAVVLIFLGLVSIGRGFTTSGEPVGSISWRPTMLVLLACALFGFLLPTMGLLVALLALCLISASASTKFAFDWKATLGLLLLITFCALVFVKGLGVPMPLVGRWIEPYVLPWLPWLG